MEETERTGEIDVCSGELIKKRYVIKDIAGQGTFGTVFNAYDKKRKKFLAIKVVRSTLSYANAAWEEATMLKTINKKDKSNTSGCVKLLSVFRINHHGKKHVCMAFEKLGKNLYDYIEDNHQLGFAWSHVQSFAKQILQAISFCHSIGVVHTDLKPENILLQNSDYTKVGGVKVPKYDTIKIIDFGNAVFLKSKPSYNIINTRYYRGPEVIKRQGWSFKSDIWSIGCIIVELKTGEPLFCVEEDDEHLDLIESITSDKKLHDMFTDEHQFVDLVENLLHPDASKRLSADDALKHVWFKDLWV